jgi:hypothetical protein
MSSKIRAETEGEFTTARALIFSIFQIPPSFDDFAAAFPHGRIVYWDDISAPARLAYQRRLLEVSTCDSRAHIAANGPSGVRGAVGVRIQEPTDQYTSVVSAGVAVGIS